MVRCFLFPRAFRGWGRFYFRQFNSQVTKKTCPRELKVTSIITINPWTSLDLHAKQYCTMAQSGDIVFDLQSEQSQKPVCDQRSRSTESAPQSGNENLSADNNQLQEVETKTLKNSQPVQERESEFEDRDELGSKQDLTNNCPVYEDPKSKKEIASGDSLTNSMNSDHSAEETISREMDADLMKNSELKETNFVENDVDLLKNCQPEVANSGNKNANLKEKSQPEYEPVSEKNLQPGMEIGKTSKKNDHSDQENADSLQNFPSEEQPFLEKNSQAGEMTTVSFENTHSKEHPPLEGKHEFGEMVDSEEELQQKQNSAQNPQLLEELELDSKENKANPRRTIQSNDKSISQIDVNGGNNQADFDSSQLKSGNLDTYHIPKDFCGLIIGKKGKTKKEIMKQSQASVEIEELKNEPFNILKITGSHDQRKHAGQLISNCLKLSDLSEYHPPSMKRGAKDKSLSTLDKNNESEHTPSKKSKRESSQTSSKVQSAKNNDELELHASKKLKKAPLEVESLKETEEDVDIDETGPLDDDSQNSQTKKKTKKKKKKKSKQEESKVSTNHQRQRQTSDKDANKPEVANKPKEIGSGEDAVRFIEEEYAELDKKQETSQKPKTASGTHNKSKAAKGQKAKPTEEKKKEENNNKTVSHDSQRANDKKEVPGKTVNNNAKSATKSDVVTDGQRERSADRQREQSADRQRERSADRRREWSAGMRDTSNDKGSKDSWDRSSSRDSKGERKEFPQQTDQRRLYSTSSKSRGGSGQDQVKSKDQGRKQAHNGSGQDQVKNKDQGRKQAHNGSGQDQVKNKDQGRKQAHNGSSQDQVKSKDQGRKQAHGSGQSQSKSLGHVRNEPVASGTKVPGRVTKFDNYTTYFIPTKRRRDIIVNKDMAIAISEESKASKESKADVQLAESDQNYPYQKINVFGTEDERQQSIRLICEKTGIQNGFPVLIVKGDLFSCPPTESLAHCVSQDLEMGMGIAVEFKKRFHGVGDLREQRKEVGDVAVLERDRRFIYYLITKPEYYNKPTYDTLSSALEAMKHHCVENKVTRVSMPMIGCGLDKLEWEWVVECIYWAFRDTKIAITVYHL